MASKIIPVDRSRCPVCRCEFVYRRPTPQTPPPGHCGRLLCCARIEWPIERWESQLRMTEARQAAGLPLDDLDRLAIAATRSRGQAA